MDPRSESIFLLVDGQRDVLVEEASLLGDEWCDGLVEAITLVDAISSNDGAPEDWRLALLTEIACTRRVNPRSTPPPRAFTGGARKARSSRPASSDDLIPRHH